jgi:hypothetical protein
MKSEERHRLQETELEKLGRRAQDFWDSFAKDYAKIALVGIGVVCLIGGILIWWMSSSAANEAERWNEVLSASFNSDPAKSLEQFAMTADKYPRHPAGQWAALMEAERSLSEGIQTARTNRKTSVSELLQAREAYNQLADSKSDLIQERRLFGLARTLETLAGVDVSGEKNGENVESVDDAIQAYQLFLQRHPESIFASLAESRIKALKTGRAQDFYAWFREQNPNPEDFKTPEDGTSPGSFPPGSLPPGHPPIGPGTSPTGPLFPDQPITEDDLMQELENIIKGTDEEKAPDLPMNPESGPTTEQPRAPEHPAPNTEENRPAQPENGETPTPNDQ